jgi:phosphoribosylformylglycinamidine synthase subunit PurS
MRARVFVTLKPSVFDPQGTTVTEALHSLGYGAVKDVRQGKYFELEIDAASADDTRRLAAEAADRLLANPVIESYRIEIDSRGEGAVATNPRGSAGASAPAGVAR